MAVNFLIWIISFCVFILLLYFSYKISYKLGIKKALYRTTYILFCVISAFVLAQFINNELFKMDLSKFNIVLRYKDNSYTTLIDYIEEVIAHSNFFNDLYKYFPSLKNLLMDFPQILLIPVTYVLLFIVFLIVWLPLYLYLSYRRKRRILYNREDKKSHRIWAGVLGCIQCVFVVSVLFSPLNGISRIYQNSINGTLDDEYGSLCDEHEALKKYDNYCDVLEAYSSTIFANIGGNDSVSNYVFDSLTRISYDDGYTSLSKEASLIIKSGIVLNQSGLLNSAGSSSDSIPLDIIVENALDDEDIDIIVDTLSNSKYSESALMELERMLPNTLNNLMKTILDDPEFNIQYSINKDDIINETKIVLKTLTMLSNSNILNEIIALRDKVVYYAEEFPENRKTDITMMAFLLDIVNSIDIDEFESLGEYLFESKIFNNMLPYIVDRYLKDYGVNFLGTNGDVLDQFYNLIDVMKLIKKYQPHDFFELILSFNEEEEVLLAEIIDYVINSPDTRGLVKYLLTEIFRDMDVNYSTSDILSIKDWKKEMDVIKDVCSLVLKLRAGGNISLSDIRELLSHKESELVSIMKTFAVNNLEFLIEELIVSLAK